MWSSSAAGRGGLAAAKGAREAGATSVLVLERDDRLGGILPQCVHDGFGLVHYKEALTGPEYARRARKEAEQAGAELKTGTMVTGLTKERVVTAVTREGLLTCRAGAVVLATGCRERTRGAIAIPGTRPAGVYTAGAAQNLLNTKNLMVGRRVVILRIRGYRADHGPTPDAGGGDRPLRGGGPARSWGPGAEREPMPL